MEKQKVEGIILNDEDKEILMNESMLNDNIIEFYLRILGKQFETEEIAIMSPFFYETIRRANTNLKTKNNEYLRTEKWLNKKNIDIKKLRYLIIPANVEFHWTLLIYCLLPYTTKPGEAPDKTPRYEKCIKEIESITPQFNNLMKKLQENSFKKEEKDTIRQQFLGMIDRLETLHKYFINIDEYFNDSPCVLVFDSLLLKQPPKYISYLISDFIQWEYERNGVEWDDVNLNINYVKVQEQTNNWECGIFLLYFVRIFLESNVFSIEALESRLRKGNPYKEKQRIMRYIDE
ncbi:Ulp1 protease family [Entamoeba marina]